MSCQSSEVGEFKFPIQIPIKATFYLVVKIEDSVIYQLRNCTPVCDVIQVNLVSDSVLQILSKPIIQEAGPYAPSYETNRRQ